MRQISHVTYFALASLLAVALWASPAAAGTSDAWLTTRIKIALFTGTGLSAKQVNVDTVRGSVTLHGTVDSEQQKARADEVARQVDGVREVRNLLQVVPERRERAVKSDDKKIKRQIRSALKRDRWLSDSRIEVKSVNHGAVLLGGEAASLSDHLRALEHARRVRGVTEVASEIKSPDRMSDDEIWRRQRGAHGESRRGAGTVASDLWITSDIKMRLISDSATPAMDINVDTRDGVVTLFGVVPSNESRLAAEADARMVDGVQKVVNALQVVPKESRESVEADDKELQAVVEKSLRDDADLAGTSINVEVSDGVARLTGTVNSQNDRLVAALNARSVTGVRAVRDDLRVETSRGEM